jgi:hypothetical protein
LTSAPLRRAIGPLLVALTLALALSAAPASATVPPQRCGKLGVGDKTYKISAHRVKCGFARKWSKRYLKKGDHPRGWACTSYPPEETRIAFACQKRGTSYYAVRK